MTSVSSLQCASVWGSTYCKYGISRKKEILQHTQQPLYYFRYHCRVMQHVPCPCEGDLDQLVSWLSVSELGCNMAALPEGGVIDSASNSPQPMACTHTHTHTHRSYPVDKAMLDRQTVLGGKAGRDTDPPPPPSTLHPPHSTSLEPKPGN